jgi:hypothetical protein
MWQFRRTPSPLQPYCNESPSSRQMRIPSGRRANFTCKSRIECDGCGMYVRALGIHISSRCGMNGQGAPRAAFDIDVRAKIGSGGAARGNGSGSSEDAKPPGCWQRDGFARGRRSPRHRAMTPPFRLKGG